MVEAIEAIGRGAEAREGEPYPLPLRMAYRDDGGDAEQEADLEHLLDRAQDVAGVAVDPLARPQDNGGGE